MTSPSSKQNHRWMILAILGTAQLMVVLDATVVNIALPSAQKALHFSDDNRQWIITAYALAFGSLLLLGGRLSDWFGRKWTIAGLSGFAFASAVGGAAQSFGMLVAARAVQGVFAALLAPAALSLLTTTFTEPSERAKAFGVFAAIAGSGASIGLLLGGVLTQSLSWRYCMYVNLVFAAVAVAGALILVRNSRPQTRPRLDIPGTLAVSSGLFALVYGFAHAQTTSWGNRLTIGMLATGVVALGVFIVIEARISTPLLPLRVVANRNRGASFLSIGIAGGAVFAVILFLTYYQQQTRGVSPITTGLAFLPMTATIMSAAILGLTKLQARFGPRPLIATGMTLGAAGTLYLTQIRVDSSYAADILPALIVIGVGLGLVFSTSISNATLGVEPGDAGVASATVNASQQVGGSLGTALLSTVAASASAHYLVGTHHVPDLIGHAAVHGYSVGFSWAAGIFAVSALVAGALFKRGVRGSEPGDRATPARHRVVVVGGGFGGLQAALKLACQPVDLTLIDRRNFHLFQPLVYQVATGALSPAEISYPLRHAFRRRGNVRVLLAEVTDIDLEARLVRLNPVAGERGYDFVSFDTLIVSAGSHYNYFGHDQWEDAAPDLKTLEGALTIRTRILQAFEAAELEPDPERRAAWLTFAVVGAGPTGVEMAGQIAEIARELRADFRSIDAGQARVLLIEAGDRVLSAFPSSLSAKAQRSLARLGVTTLLDHTVVGLDARSVTLQHANDAPRQVPARTSIWAAGVIASRLAGVLGKRAGLEVDRAGRVEVLEDLSLPGHPEVLVIGDMIRIRQGGGRSIVLPGLAPVAMQQGRHAARVVGARLHGRPGRPFRYRDKGNLATIGRASAVAEIKGLRLSGFLAWVTWLTVHLWYLIGFENRLLVLLRWAFSFIAHGRGARLITGSAQPPSTPSAGRAAVKPAAVATTGRSTQAA